MGQPHIFCKKSNVMVVLYKKICKFVGKSNKTKMPHGVRGAEKNLRLIALL